MESGYTLPTEAAKLLSCPGFSSSPIRYAGSRITIAAGVSVSKRFIVAATACWPTRSTVIDADLRRSAPESPAVVTRNAQHFGKRLSPGILTKHKLGGSYAQRRGTAMSTASEGLGITFFVLVAVVGAGLAANGTFY